MEPAAEKLAPELGGVAWREPAVPVVSNVEAAPNAELAHKLSTVLTGVGDAATGALNLELTAEECKSLRQAVVVYRETHGLDEDGEERPCCFYLDSLARRLV